MHRDSVDANSFVPCASAGSKKREVAPIALSIAGVNPISPKNLRRESFYLLRRNLALVTDAREALRTTGRFVTTFAKPNGRARRVSRTGTALRPASWSIRMPSSIAKSSASTNISASCSMLSESWFSTIACSPIRTIRSIRASSFSPAKPRRPIGSPRSSSSSSTISGARSTRSPLCGAGSRSCSCPNTTCRLRSGLSPPPTSPTRFRPPATRRAAPAI